MATPVVATGAAALGFYVWLRQWQQCGSAGVVDLPAPLETHARTEQPPTTWSETLYLFKEALRYMYQETFGRWHAIDLFFGLAYLSRRPTGEYPAADIAAAGRALHDVHTQPQEAQDLIQQLLEVKRYMLYCQGLKHHKPELQIKHWRLTTGLEPDDIISHSPIAGLLRPAYVIFLDRTSHKIILCVRGTHSRSDMFTSLTGTVKPHHVVTPQGVALGYSHLGMLAAARWLLNQTKGTLIQALDQHPGCQLRIVGHSMGGGTAAMLTMMMREKVPELSHATAWAIACPACMTLDLAASCAPFVTSLVHGADIVPTFSSGALDRLRDEVTQSSWFAEFQGDIQQRLTANFGASVRALRLTSAGEWTQRNIIHTAATSFRSCYSRAPRSCYTRVPHAPGLVASSDEHASPPVSPHAAAAPQHRSTWGFQILSSRHARQQAEHTAAGGSSSDGTSLQPAQHGSSPGGHTAAPASNTENSALLGHGQHASPLQWLKVKGGRGRRPGYAAATVSRGGSLTAGDVRSFNGPSGSEAALVEHALQACLRAADSGHLEQQQQQQPASGAATGRLGPGAAACGGVEPAAAFAAAGGTAAGRGPGLASSLVQAATKVVLRTKRPAAPGKKDDDELLQPPLQQSRSEAVWHPAAQQVQPASTAAGGPAGGPLPHQQLPLSTVPRAPGAGGAGGAAAGAGAADSPAMGASWDDGDGGSSDPATAASSASKPHPTSLRSRKGWAWGSMLGAGPGDHGWVSDDSSRRSSLAGGRRVVEYLGQTVGHTGRLMVETTGHLLKSSNALFQACTVPMQHPDAAAAAAGAAVVLGAPGQQQEGAQAQAGQGLAGAQQPQRPVQAAADRGIGGRSGIVTAPSSSGMDRDAADDPFGAALAATLAEEDEEPSDSDTDPDLQEGMDEEDSFNPLDQPALRGNISALVAAVSSDATAVGQSATRVQQEEDRAAEKLLNDMGSSTSESNIQRLALQHHAAATTERNASHSLQQQAASAAVGHSLRRDSPRCPASSAEQASGRAASSRSGGGSGDGGSSGDGSGSRDKAAEQLARRRMYPVGRILHLMPRLACPVPPPGADAAADADSTSRPPGQAGGGGGGSSSSVAGKLPPLTAALGSVGLGDDYVLLEVDRAEVYGRVKLCPAMVRDHFIPSYLRALDNVLGQLQHAAAGAGPLGHQSTPSTQQPGGRGSADGQRHVPGVAARLHTGVSAGHL